MLETSEGKRNHTTCFRREDLIQGIYYTGIGRVEKQKGEDKTNK